MTLISARYWLNKSASAAYREDIISASEKATMHPVVVIDPEDREQVGCLIEAFVNEGGFEHGGGRDNMQSAFRSLIAPPKPPEPRVSGSRVRETDGTVWTRVEGQPDKPWVYGGSDAAYDSLDVAEVLR